PVSLNIVRLTAGVSSFSSTGLSLATPKDLDDVAKIFENSFSGSSRYWSLRLLKTLDVLVATLEDKVAGAAEIYATKVKGYGNMGVIGFIAVEKEYRRRGVGRELLLEAEKVFRAKSCKFSAASTKKENTASIGLFTSLGYALYKRGSKVFEDLEAPLYAYEDDVIMLKDLSS
ncbi:MAG: GNAT family N-acetyltransferase, partial [Thermofilaceae archaeon]